MCQVRHKDPSRHDDDNKVIGTTTSQGLVSTLTGIINAWSSIIAVDNTPMTTRPQQRRLLPLPQTVMELKDRIQTDYGRNNYLWTGQVDVDCFDPHCRFTDPTLSFEGMHTYITNTQNVGPWVERLVENSQSKNKRDGIWWVN